MGALAVPLVCRLGSLIGCAGAGRRGRDPSSLKGLGGAPEGEQLPGNGAVARRVPGLARGRSRQAAAHRPRAPEAALGLSSGKRGLSCRGAASRPQSLSLTRGEAWRLTLTRSLCRAPAAIVSVRGMEEPAIPPHRLRVQGLWGIQRKPAVFLGGPRPSASRKGPRMAFPKSDRRSEAAPPSLCPFSKP